MNAVPQPRCLFPAKCPCVTYYLEPPTLAQGARKSKQALTWAQSAAAVQMEVGFHGLASANMAWGGSLSQGPAGPRSRWGVPHGFTSNNHCTDAFVVPIRAMCWCVRGGFIDWAVFLMCSKLRNYKSGWRVTMFHQLGEAHRSHSSWSLTVKCFSPGPENVLPGGVGACHENEAQHKTWPLFPCLWIAGHRRPIWWCVGKVQEINVSLLFCVFS